MPALMGWPELSVGTLADGITDYRTSHNLDIWHNDRCLDCAYLPLCFGGCRVMPMLKSGAIDELDCRKELYDAVLEEMVTGEAVVENQTSRRRPRKHPWAGQC